MVKQALVLFGLLAPAAQAADGASSAPPLTLGYYSPYAVHPGVKVGTQLRLGEPGQGTVLYVGPQLAVFTRPGNHTSLMVNADLGLRRQRPGRHLYSEWSLGAAWWGAAQIESESIDLSTGESTPIRALVHRALPTASVALGADLTPGLGGFGRVSLGQSFSPSVPAATFFSMELGLRVGASQERAP